MGTLRYVTLTGAGEKTSFAAMQRLSEAFPFVEWGVLYSPDRAGVEARYPTLDWLENFSEKARRARMNVALHLCGSAVRNLVALAPKVGLHSDNAPEPARRLFNLAQTFGRVQLNMRATKWDVPALKALIEQLTRSENRTHAILQWNLSNREACQALAGTYGFEVLADSSGGRGISPEAWPDLHDRLARHAGFAGGLGPDNIAEQLGVLNVLTKDRLFWVDMEGKLRDDEDEFDLDRCEQVPRTATETCKEFELEQGRAHGKGSRATNSLTGFWLDWWAAEVRYLDSVIPPVDACRAMLIDRAEGTFHAYQPSEQEHLAIELFHKEHIALMPQPNGEWSAFFVETPDIRSTGDSLVLAGLRAVVRKHFGQTVPKDPARGRYLTRP